MANEEKRAVRIANCSGFYGDRLSAAKEMVEGGPIDFLTGDYLAELTMVILYNQRMSRGEDKGYVGTFLKQMEQVIGDCLDKGIKIVTNAGGLNPSSMAREADAILDRLGLKAKVAYIDGDDLIPRIDELTKKGEEFLNMDKGTKLAECGDAPLTANAYLGAWGIKEALDQGADVVIAPRVTDAAVVIGPAAYWHGWDRTDYDQLAGSVAAGHIIECGAQATGGNYSFFREVKSYRNVGYPIAEIEADGSFYITKHPGTGGMVSEGTVISQLLYEINTPAYLNPDVISHFDTMKIEQAGEDRVYVSGTRGSTPPPTHKVCINTEGGYRNGMEVLLAGLDPEGKAEIYTDALFDSLGGKEQFDEVTIDLLPTGKENPETNEEAYHSLRISVKSKNPELVGQMFNRKATELGLANLPGHTGRPMGGGAGAAFIKYWPALVSSQYLTEHVHMDGKTVDVLPTQRLDLEDMYYQQVPVDIPPNPGGDTVKKPLGLLFGTRSGDKGGCANVGIWARSDEAYGFLYDFLTVEMFQELCKDTRQYQVDRHELPNLRALNFYIHGILQDGVSSSTRMDGQAKSFGEYLRAKVVDMPKSLVA